MRGMMWKLEEYEVVFFFQAEDGIRDLVRSRGLGDVYKRQPHGLSKISRHHINSNTLREEYMTD